MRRLLTPSPPDPRREAVPVRMAMVEVERALEQVAAAQEGAEAAAAAGGDGADALADVRERRGLYAYRLAVVRTPYSTTFSPSLTSCALCPAGIKQVCLIAGRSHTPDLLHRCCQTVCVVPPAPPQAYEAARELYQRHRGLLGIGGSEWPSLRCVAGCLTGGGWLPGWLGGEWGQEVVPGTRCGWPLTASTVDRCHLQCCSSAGRKPLVVRHFCATVELNSLKVAGICLCRDDLLELASPAPVEQHMRTAQRIMRSYTIFQQF
jgi:hypothetical protein